MNVRVALDWGLGGPLEKWRSDVLGRGGSAVASPSVELKPSSRGRPCRDCSSTAGDSNNESNRRSS